MYKNPLRSRLFIYYYLQSKSVYIGQIDQQWNKNELLLTALSFFLKLADDLTLNLLLKLTCSIHPCCETKWRQLKPISQRKPLATSTF